MGSPPATRPNREIGRTRLQRTLPILLVVSERHRSNGASGGRAALGTGRARLVEDMHPNGQTSGSHTVAIRALASGLALAGGQWDGVEQGDQPLVVLSS